MTDVGLMKGPMRRISSQSSQSFKHSSMKEHDSSVVSLTIISQPPPLDSRRIASATAERLVPA